MIEHDHDVIGMTSLLWAIIESAAPSEVMNHVRECLRDADMPRLASRNVAEGIYSISFCFYCH